MFKYLFIVALFFIPFTSFGATLTGGSGSTPDTSATWTRHHSGRMDNIGAGFSVTFPVDAVVSSVRVPLGRAASCSGDTWLEIKSGVVNGSSAGTVVATSNIRDCSEFRDNGSGSFNNSFNSFALEFTFSDNVHLTASTSYQVYVNSAINPEYGEFLSTNSGYPTIIIFWSTCCS